MAKKVRQNSAEAVVRYLRSIDAKLDRLNERLDRFLSAPKSKRGARSGDAGDPPRPFLVAGTLEHAAELRKKNPDADIIITGVPRAERD
jgi:hypothetical protein